MNNERLITLEMAASKPTVFFAFIVLGGGARAGTSYFGADALVTGSKPTNGSIGAVAKLSFTNVAGGVEFSLTNESAVGTQPLSELGLNLTYGLNSLNYSFMAESGSAGYFPSNPFHLIANSIDGTKGYDFDLKFADTLTGGQTVEWIIKGPGLDVDDFGAGTAPDHDLAAELHVQKIPTNRNGWIATSNLAPVPEPLTLGLGLAGVGAFLRRRLKA